MPYFKDTIVVVCQVWTRSQRTEKCDYRDNTCPSWNGDEDNSQGMLIEGWKSVMQQGKTFNISSGVNDIYYIFGLGANELYVALFVSCKLRLGTELRQTHSQLCNSMPWTVLQHRVHGLF